MKKMCYILLTIVLFSCNQKPFITDDRPKKELEFIKEIVTADSTYQAQINDITKNEIFDKSEASIPAFIKSNLNTKAENWQAVIQSIEVDKILGNVKVILRIPKEEYADEKNPEFNSIMLSSTGVYEKSEIKNSLRLLQTDDKVLVSGNFVLEKNMEGNNFGSYNYISTDNADILHNPQFDFIITDIKKQKSH